MAHAWTRDKYVAETTATIVNADDGNNGKRRGGLGCDKNKKTVFKTKTTINLASNALKEGNIKNDNNDENL